MKYDYLIAGAGIIGLTIAYELKKRAVDLKIAIVEKESDVAVHSSGRNSGILHAGFYYTKNSLKAKFTVEGNRLMKEFCKKNGIFVNETKKVVVAADQNELEGIYELQKRAQANGVQTRIIDQKELQKIDPNIVTYKKALYSPTTASVDPKAVCLRLKEILIEDRVDFYFNKNFERNNNEFKYRYLINCAGLYADKIAHEYKVGMEYTILPFKGIYLKYLTDKTAIKTNIYPVPNLKNPFLGVHFTKTFNDSIKIGPTAIPAFWRENYRGFDNFKIGELLEISYRILKLLVLNKFNFRNLAFEEIKNYNKNIFVAKAKKMVKKIENNFEPLEAGIRAQLLHKKSSELVMDFLIEHTKESTHILNAVSPAFTCSFAFAGHVVNEIEKNRESL